MPENIVGDEVESVVLNRNNLKKLDHVGALVGLIAVFVVTLHVLVVQVRSSSVAMVELLNSNQS